MEQKAKTANSYDGQCSRDPFRNLIIQGWEERFGLTQKRKYDLCNSDYWQLCLCRSDEARRLILGVST